MKRINIGIDIDGVLRDFTKSVLEYAVKTYGPTVLESYYVDKWDFPNIKLSRKEKIALWEDRYPKEIFEDGLMLNNSIKGFRQLKRALENFPEVNLICISSQLKKNIPYSLAWLAKHKFDFEEIHFTSNKHDDYYRLDYLIDDSPLNYQSWIAAGKKENNFLLYEHTYNRLELASNRIKCLEDSILFFKEALSN